MKPASEKHFRCTICQRGFTRIDHLKRHHLRRASLPRPTRVPGLAARPAELLLTVCVNLQIPASNPIRASFAARPLHAGEFG